MDVNLLLKIVKSINRGGGLGKEAVKTAIEQYREIENAQFKDPDLDVSIIYDFLFALNEGHAAVFGSHVMWAMEQAEEIKNIEHVFD